VSPAPALRTTRRTTLGGALVGVAVLAGCDLGSGDPTSAPPTSADPDDPDAGLVENVVDDVVATRQLVETLRRRHDSLRRPLGGLAQVHDAHLEVLGSSRSGQRSGRRPPRTSNAADALAVLRARELRHQRLLVERATAAQSGRLARLLASMSAAVAQHLAVLPEEEEGR
jgi:hypothetical protein